MYRVIKSRWQRAQVGARHAEFLLKQLKSLRQEYPGLIDRAPKKISVIFQDGIGGGHDVGLRWDDDDLTIVMPYALGRWLHISRLRQLMTIMVWFLKAGPEVRAITFNLSDGETATTARFTSSSFKPEIIPVPDAYFYGTRGFRDAHQLSLQTNLSWDQRDDRLIWRGAAVGTGNLNPDPALATNLGISQRIRFAHLVKGTVVDFKFVPHDNVIANWPVVQRAGLSGSFIPEHTWANRKYAIDIDGFTNTWSNLIIRLHYGCCVLKVASQYGYRQWYYDKLIPFEHFVPVAADLSDFWERWDWVQSHPGEAAAIAAAGQEFVRKMTFNSEADVAATLIRDYWKDC